MIRKATVDDAARIAEIDVISERCAYKEIVPEELLYKALLVGNRINLFKEWISQNSFEIYVYEAPE